MKRAIMFLTVFVTTLPFSANATQRIDLVSCKGNGWIGPISMTSGESLDSQNFRVSYYSEARNGVQIVISLKQDSDLRPTDLITVKHRPSPDLPVIESSAYNFIRVKTASDTVECTTQR